MVGGMYFQGCFEKFVLGERIMGRVWEQKLEVILMDKKDWLRF